MSIPRKISKKEYNTRRRKFGKGINGELERTDFKYRLAWKNRLIASHPDGVTGKKRSGRG